MVNYCCVQGCGRNSKNNKHLNYFSLPKERRRQVEWLQAAGRDDLLDKDKALVSHRFCSRHFPASAIKNKHLCDTALPTLYLPGTWIEDEVQHNGIVCDSCHMPILGFRYKCVSCEDFDLCQKCEMRETHPHHYMLRMPKPLKYKLADNLITKWQSFFNAKHEIPSSDSEEEKPKYDSDDEPITKYVRNYDSGVDLSEDVKKLIRGEVSRVLANPSVVKRQRKNPLLMSKKRMGEEIKRSIKRIRMDGTIGYDYEDGIVPEVAFADVNEGAMTEVKNENISAEEQPVVHVKLSEDLTELMIEMAPPQSET
ncbi:hypothetical protein MSG28_011446 [Choristoneura fumiferana]|uniref:Uncharacterized protein n=1 Tax=Choristoneura fumiferana TaxID=7141 RepID=A0ACC0JNF7_CHOFU|nr:hypothetical protein MSG28_011446 [Choristoneura fumiferana]